MYMNRYNSETLAGQMERIGGTSELVISALDDTRGLVEAAISSTATSLATLFEDLGEQPNWDEQQKRTAALRLGRCLPAFPLYAATVDRALTLIFEVALFPEPDTAVYYVYGRARELEPELLDRSLGLFSVMPIPKTTETYEWFERDLGLTTADLILAMYRLQPRNAWSRGIPSIVQRLLRRRR